MPRRKSINDIRAQRDRIVTASRARGRELRAQRAEQTAWRYQTNIMSSRRYQDGMYRADRQPIREAAATILAGNRVPYSRSVYMGLNNG